jgi:hypothetical protein
METSPLYKLPAIPFNELHSFLFAIAATILAIIFLYRLIRSEICRRRCDLCGERVRADEHGHHVTVCALKLMLLGALRR